MSMTIVSHVREKSNARSSARTLLLDLAIYANDCCGVAWPADATLRHDTNVSHQRIHELKNALKASGELVIVERPGFTSLYCVAWQGKPVGGTFPETGRHDPHCPLRHAPAPKEREGSEFSDPPDPGEGSDISEGGSQMSLSRKQKKTREKTAAPPAPFAHAPEPKAERRSPFWCDAHGFAHGDRLPDHRPDCAREYVKPGEVPHRI